METSHGANYCFLLQDLIHEKIEQKIIRPIGANNVAGPSNTENRSRQSVNVCEGSSEAEISIGAEVHQVQTRGKKAKAAMISLDEEDEDGSPLQPDVPSKESEMQQTLAKLTKKATEIATGRTQKSKLYDIIAHLKKIPAVVSVFEVLKFSPGTRLAPIFLSN